MSPKFVNVMPFYNFPKSLQKYKVYVMALAIDPFIHWTPKRSKHVLYIIFFCENDKLELIEVVL